MKRKGILSRIAEAVQENFIRMSEEQSVIVNNAIYNQCKLHIGVAKKLEKESVTIQDVIADAPGAATGIHRAVSLLTAEGYDVNYDMSYVTCEEGSTISYPTDSVIDYTIDTTW